MEEIISVGLGELYISNKKDEVLVAYGLGSCIGIAAYDNIEKIGGMLHIMLPTTNSNNNIANKTKFADTGIPLLIEKMIKKGAKSNNICIKIAGGAKMFKVKNTNPIFDIGEKNIIAVKKVLKLLDFKVASEDIGLNYGRTMELYINSGKVYIRAFGRDKKEL